VSLVIASRVYHGVKPFYWLRSARATAHFTCSGLVETDRLTEKAEKAREGTNCIISTKAMSTVDAVEIDIDAHQDAHWWSPLFLTYCIPTPKSLSIYHRALQSAFHFVRPSKNHRTTAFAGYNSWRGATVLRASHHGSYFINWGLDGGLHQPHWNVGTKIPTINIPITNRHREHPCPAKRATREISAFQTRGSREHGLSLLLDCERKNQRHYDATLPLHISPEDNLRGEFHDSHAKRSISWGSTSR